MSISQTAGIAKVRLRLADRSTRRDGTAITTPRFSDTDISTALNDAIRDRQPLIQTHDPTFYKSTLDFIGVTDKIATDTSSTTLPVAASEQYAAPTNMKEYIRLARRDITGFPTVRLVPLESQDAIYSGYGTLFSPTAEDTCTNETVALVTYNTTGTATNRLRIKPAPAAATYLYRLFFVRIPTEPDTASDTLDIPSTFLEVVALDAAVNLAASVNLGTLGTLMALRDRALAARLDDPPGRNAGRRVIQNARP